MDSEKKNEIRNRYLKVDTAIAADVLDELGMKNQGIDSNIQAASGNRLAGWAYTICGQMIPYSESGDPDKMTACHGIDENEVSVWSGNGNGVCYFGEMIALGMIECGCTGALIDGGIRDTRALNEQNFTTFARYRTAVQSIGRWKVTSWQEPVYIAGATVKHVEINPGDFILGDEDGAIVIPKTYISDVLNKSEETTRAENEVRHAIENGMKLTDALSKFGHV